MAHSFGSALTLGLLAGTASSQVSFQHRIIDPQPPQDPHCKAVGDLNGDGYVDVVVAGLSGEIAWYEERSAHPAWTRHVVVTPGASPGHWSTDAECADLDGDGDDDIVLSDWEVNNRLYWFENLGAGQGFTAHAIGSPRAHDIEVGDLDRDGDLDLVTRGKSSSGDELHVWFNDASGTAWRHEVFAPQALGPGEGLAVGDVDGDGDPDLVVGGLWFETLPGTQDADWITHVYDPNLTQPDTFVALADFDGDGRIDIVAAPSEAAGGTGEVAWYQAPADLQSGPWPKQVVEAGVETVVHGLRAADVDGDGDVDIVTAEMEQGANPDEVSVHLNLDAAGGAWDEQVIAVSGSHSIRVVDVGADGDLDIVGSNWHGSVPLELWENETSGGGGGPFCEDGSACPCGNAGSAGRGCRNSSGAAAMLAASGSRSVGLDELVLTASPVPSGSIGLLAMSGTWQAGRPLGDGVICLMTSVYRFQPVRSNAGSLVHGPGLVAGSRRFGPPGEILAGSTWAFQSWFRDPSGPCATGSNLSVGQVIVFVP